MEGFEVLPAVTRISKTVTRILGQNPGKFTLQGTNTYLVGERNPYVLIDTGEGKEEYIPLLQDVLSDSARETMPGEPHISDIIITHRHHDHTHGLPSVLALLRRLWDTQGSVSPYKPPRIHKIPLSVPEPGLTSVIASLLPGSYTPSPNGAALHDLSDSDTIPLPSASPTSPESTLHIIHTPGHTPDSLCIYYPADRALFTADTVLGHGSAVFEDLGTYMASLQKMLDFAHADRTGTTYDVVYPGHGPVVKDGVGRVATYLKHRLEREEQIVQALQQPHAYGPDVPGSHREGWTIESLVATIYASYPKELWAPAAHSVELHLNKLLEEGRVEKAGPVWVLMN